MFARVFHTEAQIAASPVQIQRASLEDGLVLAPIKVAEETKLRSSWIRSRLRRTSLSTAAMELASVQSENMRMRDPFKATGVNTP